MDLFRRAYTQLHDRFRAMTPGSRLMAAMLAAALLVGLGYLATQQAAWPDTDLMHGVPVANSRLPLMEAALGKAKLTITRFVLRRFAGRRFSCRAGKSRSIWTPSSRQTHCRAVWTKRKAMPSTAALLGNRFLPRAATEQDRQATGRGRGHSIAARHRGRQRHLRRDQDQRLSAESGKGRRLCMARRIEPTRRGHRDRHSQRRSRRLRRVEAGKRHRLRSERSHLARQRRQRGRNQVPCR